MSSANRKSHIPNRKWEWLPDMDLNHDKQIQSLLCYRYTIGQKNTPRIVNGLDESRPAKGNGAEAFGSDCVEAAEHVGGVAHGILKSPATFPLTPALSLGEREPRSPSPEQLWFAGCANARPTILPLPEGEGWGEGKRDVQPPRYDSTLQRFNASTA
jgi:hypothetical protein